MPTNLDFGGKYDDAEWHYAGDFPEDVPITNGFSHIGFYLTWAAERELVSDFFREESAAALQQVGSREKSPIYLLEIWDGKLTDDMLSEEGNAYSQAYYQLDDLAQGYFVDYNSVFPDSGAGPYHVKPSWDNYDRIKPVLDRRFEEWRAGR